MLAKVKIRVIWPRHHSEAYDYVGLSLIPCAFTTPSENSRKDMPLYMYQKEGTLVSRYWATGVNMYEKESRYM